MKAHITIFFVVRWKYRRNWNLLVVIAKWDTSAACFKNFRKYHLRTRRRSYMGRRGRYLKCVIEEGLPESAIPIIEWESVISI